VQCCRLTSGIKFIPSLQLAGQGTEECTPPWMVIVLQGKFILKNMMFRVVTIVLNERKHLQMVFRSISVSVTQILG
jgi:hypothetical protein